MEVIIQNKGPAKQNKTKTVIYQVKFEQRIKHTLQNNLSTKRNKKIGNGGEQVIEENIKNGMAFKF